MVNVQRQPYSLQKGFFFFLSCGWPFKLSAQLLGALSLCRLTGQSCTSLQGESGAAWPRWLMVLHGISDPLVEVWCSRSCGCGVGMSSLPVFKMLQGLEFWWRERGLRVCETSHLGHGCGLDAAAPASHSAATTATRSNSGASAATAPRSPSTAATVADDVSTAATASTSAATTATSIGDVVPPAVIMGCAAAMTWVRCCDTASAAVSQGAGVGSSEWQVGRVGSSFPVRHVKPVRTKNS